MAQRIGYLGPKGTFTKLAVDKTFDEGEKIQYATIPECIDAVKDGGIDYAVVPLENSIEGTVHLTLDYLVHEVKLPVVGEIVLPIRQHLLVRKDFNGDLADIEAVYSHSHAIAQCNQFLHKLMPKADIHHSTSTARAAERISQMTPSVASIGNELGAKEFDLNVLKYDIHDYENNHTRFAILAREKDVPIVRLEKESEKTSLLVTLPRDHAGALHQVLSAFAWRKMNLSKIESRPMKTGLGNYFFIIDVNQPYDHYLFPGVIGELEALGCHITILGTFPVYQAD